MSTDLDRMRNRYAKTDEAVATIRRAVTLLTNAGADKAAEATRRALKSAEGARRNAERFLHQAEREAAGLPVGPLFVDHCEDPSTCTLHRRKP